MAIGRFSQLLSRYPILYKIADFANVFKSFIGANYLSLPYAFYQSGLIFGIVGVWIIAFLTDHCCLLMINCKKVIIEQILDTKFSHVYEADTEEYLEADKRKRQQRVVLEKAMTYSDVGQLSMGKCGFYIVNVALFITQFGCGVNYFILMGDTIMKIFPVNDTTSPGNSSNLIMTTQKKHHERAPDLIYLMLIPFPLVVLLTYIRKVRNIAPLSAIANMCIFLGFFSILGFIFSGLHIDNIHKVKLYGFSNLPVFFGQIIGAYEGIGTVVPVEASMGRNRPNFPKFLHSAIFCVSLILSTFGIFGYLHYVDNVDQLISNNLEYGVLSIVVQVTLFTSILLTFPLQFFPAVQIIENVLFRDTKGRSTLVNSMNKDYNSLFHDTINAQLDSRERTEEQEESSVEDSDDEELTNIVDFKETRRGCDMSWSTWQRNIVRTIMVMASFGLAYLGRNYYVYIYAFSGSIGSSLLAFVLPCSFHLIIKKDRLPVFVIVKDIFLILFGIIAGLVGVVTIIIRLIES